MVVDNNKIQLFRNEVEKRKGQLGLLKAQVLDKTKRVDGLLYEVEVSTKARWVLAETARISQGQLTEYIESIVTMAIRSVYDRPFRFIVDFRINRNKSECYLMVYEGEEKSREEMVAEAFFPEDEEGGGLLDIISLALKVVLWSLENPRSRATLLEDEPMKNLGSLRPLAVKLLKRMSQDLGIQYLIITHEDELAEVADKAWRVVYRNGESKVSQIFPFVSQGEAELPVVKKSARRRIV